MLALPGWERRPTKCHAKNKPGKRNELLELAESGLDPSPETSLSSIHSFAIIFSRLFSFPILERELLGSYKTNLWFELSHSQDSLEKFGGKWYEKAGCRKQSYWPVYRIKEALHCFFRFVHTTVTHSLKQVSKTRIIHVICIFTWKKKNNNNNKREKTVTLFCFLNMKKFGMTLGTWN